MLEQVLELLEQVLERICPDISGHVRTSGYPLTSKCPDIHTHATIHKSEHSAHGMLARSKHTAHALSAWVYYTITPNTIAAPPSTSLSLSMRLSISEASAGLILQVLGGRGLLLV